MPARVNAHLLVTKLWQLGCEKNYCVPNGLPSFTPSSFCKESSSPLDQLIQTVRLCQWLLSLLDVSLQDINEVDEPTAVSMSLLGACKNIVDVTNIPPHRIRMGYGDDLTALVLALAEACMAKLQPSVVSWKTLGSEAAGADEEQDDDENLMIDDFIADDVLMGTMTAKRGQITAPVGFAANALPKESGYIAPGLISEADWEQELMAVDGQLGGKHFGGVDHDWRRDIAAMSILAKSLVKETASCTQSLNSLVTSFTKQLERITSREQHLNGQVGQYSTQLGEASRTHSAVTEELAEISQSIVTLTDELSAAKDRLRTLKTELQVESARASDTSNIHVVKTAFSSLSGEIRQLDLRITLAQQRLFVIAPSEHGVER